VTAFAREVVPVPARVLVRALVNAPSDAPTRLREGIGRATGARHVALMSSARLGILLLLEALARRTGEGEIVLWGYNFFAVPDMVRLAGFTPVFVDADDTFGQPSVERVRSVVGPRTRGILVSHHFGRPSDVVRWRTLADELGIAVVEDCAHAFGASVEGRSVGLWGMGGAFSLSLTKALTGVAGGVVISNADDVIALLRDREAQLPAPERTAVNKSIVSALGGRMLLDPALYSLVLHPGNRLSGLMGVDPLDALMTEPPRDPSEPVTRPPEFGIAPAWAAVACHHLQSVEAERAARERAARTLIESTDWGEIEPPPFETDRRSAWLNFVVRVSNVPAFRKHLLAAGFDTRRDYILAMSAASNELPRARALESRGVYLPLRTVAGDDDAIARLSRAIGTFRAC
jgi:dTDP-4-amino-4,6-dideoxygalactose transaminase